MAVKSMLETARRFWIDGRGQHPGRRQRRQAVARAARSACQRCYIENMESRVLLSTVEIIAIEDAYGRSGTNAALNYGGESQIMVKQEGTVSNSTRNAFLKFNVDPLPDGAVINSISLKLWGWNGDLGENRNQTVNVGVYGVDDTTWVQGTATGQAQAGSLTWSNMPALIGDPMSVQPIAPTATHEPYAWDVASWIAGRSGLVSLGLKAQTGTDDRAFFTSLENSLTAEHPRLIIVYNEPPSAAPATFTATGAPQSAVLNWTAVAGATKYAIYRTTTPWDEPSWSKIGESTELSYLSSGLTNGTSYSYRVRAANQFGESAQFAEASATPQAAPPVAVAGISIERSAGQVALSWPASNGAQSYTVKRGTSSGALAALPAGTNILINSFVDDTAVDGQVYYYIITASNSIASVDSPVQPVGAGLPGTYYDNMDFTNPVLTRLDPTINFAWATGSPDPLIGPDTFSTHWMGNLWVPETAGYDFTMTIDDGGSLYVGGNLVIDRPVYSATEASGYLYLEAGSYPIEVRQFENTGGAGIQLRWTYYSNTLATQFNKVIIPQHALFAPDLDAPTTAATEPAAIATSKSSVLLTWVHTATNESGFRIESSIVGQNQFTEAAIAPAQAASWVVTGLSPSTAYDFRIVAFNNAGDAPAATVTQTTLAAGMGNAAMHWTYEDGAGSSQVTDQSGNGFNGFISGDPNTMYQPGREGTYALLLNGAGTDYEYVYASDPNAASVPTSAMAFATWIKPIDWNGNYYLASRNSWEGRQFRLWNNNGRLTGEIAGVGTVSTPLPPANQWSHVALTYDGGTITLYVNSVPAGMTSADGQVREASQVLNIGTDDGVAANQQFKGLIDDTRLFGRSIDRDDLAALVSGAALPAAPTGLLARAMSALRVELKWTDNASNDTAYVIERKEGAGGEWLVISPADYVPLGGAFIDAAVMDGIEYIYRVKATNSNGSSAWSNESTATAAVSVVPAPWANQDIGAVNLEGEAYYTAANSSFTVVGDGNDIWNNADQFHYVYQPWNGDGMITARVASLTPTDPWAKVGVMFRETLDAGSRHVANIVSRDNGTAFSGRIDINGTSTRWSVLTGHIADPNGRREAPYWVRLKRAGDLFSAWTSPDGTTWEQLGPTQSITMLGDPETGGIYVGLAVTSHNINALNTAVFDNVAVTSTVIPDAPTGLAVATSFDRADLAWNLTLGAESYEVLRATSSGGLFLPIGTTLGTTFIDTGVTTGNTYYYMVRAINEGGYTQSAEVSAVINALQARINFTTAGGEDVAGYFKDGGAVYGPRAGTGFSYGWDIDNSGSARDRDNANFNFATNPYLELLDSLNHTQQNSGNRVWEVALPPGQYEVRVVSGDPGTNVAGNSDSYFAFLVEGVSVVKGEPFAGVTDTGTGLPNQSPLYIGGPNGERIWADNNAATGAFLGGTPVTVTVVDGRLTLANDLDAQAAFRAATGQTGNQGANNKVNYIEIVQISAIVSDDVHLTGTDGDDIYHIQLDETGNTVQIWQNADPATAAPTRTVAVGMLNLITVDSGLGNDTVTVDFVNGAPLGSAGLSFNGGDGADRINVIGSSDADTISASEAQVLFGEHAITLLDVGQIGLDGAGGEDVITASGSASVIFSNSQDLAALNIEDTAKVTLAGGGDKALRITGGNIAAGAAMDLVDNDLILTATAETRAEAMMVLAAFMQAGQGGTTGLFASASTDTTGLSLSINDNGAGVARKDALGGLAAGVNDVIAMFTAIGDLDLSGGLDGDDYFLLDQAFLAASLANLPYNADLNFSGAVNAADYFIIDKAFLTLSVPVLPAPAQQAAQPSQDDDGLELADDSDILA